ncbi:trimeric LpxA-like protein [Morchella snyderi]|nr:trimeric LpxA-like protein [Morchella snyderi]
MDTTEKDKMLRGELYIALDPLLCSERERCAKACHEFNTNTTATPLERANLLNNILGLSPVSPSTDLSTLPTVNPPFIVDYGYNVTLGEGSFINFNCTILDTCPVHIGARTLFGPGISIFTASHPLSAAVRNGLKGPEDGRPIVIGDDCWFGGNVVVLPGVTIGDCVVVGAGAVVTKSVPSHCVVAGNPARIVKRLEGFVEPAAAAVVEAKGREKEGEMERLVKRLDALERELAGVKGELKSLSK